MFDLTPPQNLDAEAAFLGAFFNDNAVYERAGFLRPEHFFEPVHGRIWAACLAQIDKGGRADPIVLRAHFDNDEGLAEIGGADYLMRLFKSAATVINAPEYARTIKDLYVRRELILASRDLIEQAMEADIATRPSEIASNALDTFEKLLASGSSARVRFADQLVFDTEKRVNAATDLVRDGKMAGVTTGLKDLDHMTGGFQAGQLIVIAARPSMGKSLLAGTLAVNAAKSGVGVLIFNYEMPGVDVMARMISEATHRVSAEEMKPWSGESVPYSKALRGRLSDNELRLFSRGAADVGSLPIAVCDEQSMRIRKIVQVTKKYRREFKKHYDGKHDLGMVIVDYLQLVEGEGTGNRVQDVAGISLGLKSLAMDLEIPVIALSQLNRAVEHRDPPIPMLSDLRDSGTIEQDADVVQFLYRPAYYAEKKGDVPTEDLNKLTIIQSKHRNGPTGRKDFYIDVKTGRIRDLERG